MARLLKGVVAFGLGCVVGCTSPGDRGDSFPSTQSLQAIAPPEQLTSIVQPSPAQGLIEDDEISSFQLGKENAAVETVGFVQPLFTAETGQPEKQAFGEESTFVVDVGEDPVEILLDDSETVVGEYISENGVSIPLNLPSVLAAIDSRHPIVGRAQWSVQQAYAAVDQADVLWLPSIQAGFSFHRHDGNYQASDGQIIDVNRNSFQFGLGSGATGAGTTNTRPGIVADFRLADAIFQPRVARRQAWARGHAARAVMNQQMMTAALAYFDFLDAYQDLRIAEESQGRFEELANLTINFAEAGEGLNADADRLRTELALVKNRRIQMEERVEVAEAGLARAISLSQPGRIVPLDANAMPVEFASELDDEATLVQTSLVMRPELKESQALVSAACEAYRQEKYAPFIPSVLLGFSSSGFGGGLGNNLNNVDERYDLDALLSWRIRNLGLGEDAIRRERAARIQQARYEKLRVMDDVAFEVREAIAQVRNRQRQIETARLAIETAEDSYRLNLERIRDGEGLPLEALQSAEALETTQREYLRSVIRYNQAQIRLQWAMGFPVAG